MVCKYCGCKRFKKDGVRNDVQKWRCKECNQSHGEIDRRSRYDEMAVDDMFGGQRICEF